ncbi:hypothetical protein B0H10DRAFT_1947556 [Mycena sp. CBHHK59/15]|nr:hypothetical protein B0H10DRAFT_1947556 [Mycena sp. CBHHK59/15]
MMESFPDKLILSALTWRGRPTTWTVDCHYPDYVGTYEKLHRVLGPSSLNLVIMSGSVNGPPFQFYTVDWDGDTGINPDCLDGLTFSPDVPSQPDEEPLEENGHEPDSFVGLGWHGSWIRTLLERKDRGLPLGELNFSGTLCKNRLGCVSQAAEMQSDLYAEGASSVFSRGISAYTIQANIVRVYLKDAGFVREEEESDVE